MFKILISSATFSQTASQIIVGTRLAQRGVPVPVIKDIMAHSDIKTTMRYVHTAEEQMQKAMEVLYNLTDKCERRNVEII